MKRLLLFLFMLVAVPCYGQMSTSGTVSQSATTCSSLYSGGCIGLALFNSPALSTSSATITLAGSFTATMQFEASGDNAVTWVAISGTPSGGGAAVTSATAAGTWSFTIAGYTHIRARCSAFTSTPTITIQASAPGVTYNVTQGGTGGGAGAPGVFTASTSCGGTVNCVQWVDDDATDNCTAATTAWMNSINAYNGPGAVQVFIYGSGPGKAYLFKTCNLIFNDTLTATGGITVWANASFDAGTNSSANLIQVGDGTHGMQFRWTGGTFSGGASLTVGGFEIKASTAQFFLSDINWSNFGAGNATLGNCTNFAIAIDNFPFSGVVARNWWFNSDNTTGRCFAANNTTTSGEGTVFWIDNNIEGQSASFCASQGIVDGGFYGNILQNNIGSLAVDIRLQGGGHRIEANQLDTEGCTASGVNAPIQFGANGSAANIDAINISNNVAQFGAGHSTNLFQKAGNSTGTVSDVVIIGNQQAVTASTSAAVLGGGGINCGNGLTAFSFCSMYGNTGLIQAPQCGANNINWAVGASLAACATAGQTNNLGNTLLFTSPNTTTGSLGVVVTCQVMLSTAAATSSTLPQCEVVYTDNLTSTTQTLLLTPVWAANVAGCSGTTTNTVGNSCQGSSGVINPKKNTAVNYATINYASVSANTMAYQVYVTATLTD